MNIVGSDGRATDEFALWTQEQVFSLEALRIDMEDLKKQVGATSSTGIDVDAISQIKSCLSTAVDKILVHMTVSDECLGRYLEASAQQQRSLDEKLQSVVTNLQIKGSPTTYSLNCAPVWGEYENLLQKDEGYQVYLNKLCENIVNDVDSTIRRGIRMHHQGGGKLEEEYTRRKDNSVNSVIDIDCVELKELKFVSSLPAQEASFTKSCLRDQESKSQGSTVTVMFQHECEDLGSSGVHSMPLSEMKTEQTILPSARSSSNKSDVKYARSDAVIRESYLHRHQTLSKLVHRLHGTDSLGDTPYQRLLSSFSFQSVVSVLILLQSATLGAEVDIELRYQYNRLLGRESRQVPGCFDFFAHGLNVIFTLELVVRIAVLRKRFFCVGDLDTRGWNYFDLVVVILSLPDFFPSVLPSFRFLRTLRMFRVVRVVRVLRYATELRKMIFALLHCISSLMWLCALLFLLLYLFALIFMQGVSGQLESIDPTQASLAKKHYKPWIGLDISIMSLFGVITGGEEWDNVLNPVMDIHWAYHVLGMFFVVFFVFGFMNVATGLFVDRAMEIAAQDRQSLMEDAKAQAQKEELILRELFQGSDLDEDGILQTKELSEVLRHPDVQDYLTSIGLDISNDIEPIVKAMDPSGKGYVRAETFFELMSRFKGTPSVQPEVWMPHY